MKPNLSRFDPTRVGDTVAALKSGLVKPFHDVHDLVRRGLANQLTLEDNMRAVVTTLPLVHGVEYSFDRPKTLPYPKWCRLLDSVLANEVLSLPVQSLQLNRTRTDGKLGITAWFSPPAGLLRLAKSANQAAVASAVITAVTWDVQLDVAPGALSHSTTVANTRVTCAAAGFVELNMQLCWGALSAGAFAAGDRITCFANKNGVDAGANARRGRQQYGAAATSDTNNSTAIVPVVAGDYLEAKGFQQNGAAATRDLNGNQTNECILSARYSAPPVGYSANVTFALGDA